jgi:hypothetical protein
MAIVLHPNVPRLRSRALSLAAALALAGAVAAIGGTAMHTLGVSSQPPAVPAQTGRAAAEMGLRSAQAEASPALVYDFTSPSAACTRAFSGDLVGDASPLEVYQTLCPEAARAGR